MAKRCAVTALVVFAGIWSAMASAEFLRESGDFDFGPQKDVIKGTAVCIVAKDMFQILDGILVKADQSKLSKKLDDFVAAKRCKYVPASSVWVTKIRIGIFKVDGEEVWFPVGKVIIDSFEYYAAPDALVNTGSEMGQLVQRAQSKATNN